jgi:hypothetical protein
VDSATQPYCVFRIVGVRPDDQGGVLTGDSDSLRSFRLDATSDPDKGVLLPFPAERRLVGVTGEDTRLRRQLHQEDVDRCSVC